MNIELDAIDWLIAGNVIIWLGIGLYVAFLAATQRKIALRLARFEALREDRDD